MKSRKSRFSPDSTVGIQLSLDDLLPGQKIAVPLPAKAIGGELLNILSKGLYTNPLDAIREYVQNAIDANSEEVTIQITGNSVWIMDNGVGMDRDQLLQAREFGVSQKSMQGNVGFRGIGIYSGFDLCERLLIRTRSDGENLEHILTFEFGEMRRKLEQARLDPDRPVVPLPDLLSEHIQYEFEEDIAESPSFTLVQLEQLSNSHIHKLSNISGMKDYILKNLPVRFSSEFNYAEMIETQLRQHVPGYKSARIKLIIENNNPLFVEKPNIPNLESPIMGEISDSTGKKHAYYWSCINSKSERINSDFAGLVYKVKGFTIGDRQHLSEKFTRKQVYPWQTGEIYVINPELIPTSARDDFEAGPIKDAFELAVSDVLCRKPDSLQKKILDSQATKRADSVIESSVIKIEKIDTQLSSGEKYDDFEIYKDLAGIIDAVKQQKGKATDKQKVTSLLKRAEVLQRKVRKEVDLQPGSSVGSKIKDSHTSQYSLFHQEDNQDQYDERKGSTEKTNESPTNNNSVVPYLGIRDLITNAGWEISDELTEVINILDEMISVYLSFNDHKYKEFLDDFRARLDEFSQGVE